MLKNPNTNVAERELTITRLFRAPADKIYEAYTNPEILKQWWVPRPWIISSAEVDPCPGGVFRSTMRDPEGNEYPNDGIILEAIPGKRLVFTDAITEGWMPNPDLFMLAVIELAEEAGGTRVTAYVRHWTVEKKTEHEKMGFHDGWGTALAQLAELVEA
jgi:uncharacterized protein YndB with AHSA1/START domain